MTRSVLPSRRRRFAVAWVLVLLLLLVAAAQASATTRFAVPGGTATDPDCLTKAANCSIQRANDVASDGDELIVTSGTYDFGNSAGPVLTKVLSVHGEDGKPRPLLTGSSSDWTLTSLGGDSTIIRRLTFEQKGSGNALAVVGSSTGNDVTVENVVAIARGTGNGAIALIGSFGGALDVQDSTAFAPGAGATAFANSTAVLARNVTAIAPGTGGVGFDQRCTNWLFSGCNGDSLGFVSNSIVDGGPSGFDVKTNTGSCANTCTNYHTSVSLNASNYDSVGNCSGCTITTPGPPNNQTAAYKLADPANGDFHELVASPTRDAGHNTGPGFFDPDGNPRVLGPAPDIGAFEYNGTPLATTLPASAIGANTARLNASVDPRGFETSFQFQWGTTTAYGNQAPPAPATAGSGTGATPVFTDVAGLPKGTVIHYRVMASSAYGGTTLGADRTFTTAGSGPATVFGGIKLKTRKYKVKKGAVTFSLRCPATVSGRCTGTLALRTAKKVAARKGAKKRRLALGKHSFSIASGKTGKVVVKLNKTARKLLRKHRSLKARATITATANGRKRVTTQSVTLALPAKKKG
jgi:hypothetical protein